MRRFGREDDLEKLNRNAMLIARKIAGKHNKLVAGGLSNTPLYKKNDTESHKEIYEMFKVKNNFSRLILKCINIS